MGIYTNGDGGIYGIVINKNVNIHTEFEIFRAVFSERMTRREIKSVERAYNELSEDDRSNANALILTECSTTYNLENTTASKMWFPVTRLALEKLFVENNASI